MRDRLIRLAGRLYPASWRRRYGVEFEALIEDASRDWRDVFDVLLGALKMQLTTWSFGKIAAGFGVAGAVLFFALSFIAMPDKYTSYCTLRLTKSLLSGDPQPATDNTEEFVKSLIQNALAKKSMADIINNQGLYPRAGEEADGRRDREDAARRELRTDWGFERVPCELSV